MQRPTQGHRDCASLRQFLARGGDHLVVLVEAAVREDAVHDDATHPLQLREHLGRSELPRSAPEALENWLATFAHFSPSDSVLDHYQHKLG